MANENTSGLVRIAALDAILDKSKANVLFEVKALNARESGDFEYIALVRVPSLDMAKPSAAPLSVHLDSDLTAIEISLLERKGKAHEEIQYEIELPDGTKKKGVTDGD